MVDVIVVGAGIAGITAARDLQNNGYEVQLLEARERAGGRIWSDETLGMPLDLGASWIHGIRDNPIARLAKKYSIETQATLFTNHSPSRYQACVAYKNGKELPREDCFQLSNYLANVVDFIKTLPDKNSQTSVAETIEKMLQEGEYDKHQADLIRYLAEIYFVYEYAGDLDDISTVELNKSLAFPGHDRIFKSGYGRLIDKMVEELDIPILFNQNVKLIDYSGDTVAVITQSGVEYQATYVLVTVPLGVLQKGDLLFNPHLPQANRTAINKLKMGLLDKVYLKFPALFWEKEKELIITLDNDADYFPEFINYYRLLDEPVLMAFSAGSFAKKVEAMSDEDIIEQIMGTLQRHYGSAIPKPEKYKITRWFEDPLSYGAYSYLPAGVERDNRNALAMPVDNKVFFAGEATSFYFPSTVHGAFLSGVRSAYEIMLIDAMITDVRNLPSDSNLSRI